MSRLTGAFARIPVPRPLRRALYGAYARRYGVAVEEAERPVEEYPTMDDFFTRRLREGVRPVDPDRRALVSPVDGAVSAVGVADGETLLQAKGLDYTLSDLLAGDARHREFFGGPFLTLYLAPGDCHRVYAPFDLRVADAKRVGGTLRPVRTSSVERVPRLFCENERRILYLETGFGPAALVVVGALNVGSIELCAKPGEAVAKGGEIAVFHLGSTVILLLPRGKARWEALTVLDRVRIGQKIGVWA